jgi:23S rRNA pseudouridine2605 synthase
VQGNRDAGNNKQKRVTKKRGKEAALAMSPRSGAPLRGQETKQEAKQKERIAKRIARAGLCSRREAERWIEAGRVKVDGKIINSSALNVGDENIVLVDDKPLPEKEQTRLWLYHKPKGVVTTNHDPEGRPTVFEKLPEDMPRVVTVGRLDMNSEGLLLLTNDGEYARELELPSNKLKRVYRVRVHKTPNDQVIKQLAQGVNIDNIRYAPIKVIIDRSEKSNVWLTVTLREGKNREIRKLFEHFGHPVSRLIRIAYGVHELGKLAKGEVKEVKNLK